MCVYIIHYLFNTHTYVCVIFTSVNWLLHSINWKQLVYTAQYLLSSELVFHSKQPFKSTSKICTFYTDSTPGQMLSRNILFEMSNWCNAGPMTVRIASELLRANNNNRILKKQVEVRFSCSSLARLVSRSQDLCDSTPHDLPGTRSLFCDLFMLGALQRTWQLLSVCLRSVQFCSGAQRLIWYSYDCSTHPDTAASHHCQWQLMCKSTHKPQWMTAEISLS